MSSPCCCVIKGCFTIISYEPDGDSVRFIADNPDLYQNLQGSYRIKPSKKDGSVQLRFEAVDTPETHYGSAAQPFGDKARDHLLAWMGFKNIRYSSKNLDKIEFCEPEKVRGAILSKAAETNGRPVAYVILEADANLLDDGDWIRVDEALLENTINYCLLKEGIAYYTVYTSTPYSHRRLLSEVASEARDANKGIWELDMTTEFVLEDNDSIGSCGQLILPKLFRRCSDYLKSVEKGFKGNLEDWLVWVSSGSRDENDHVVVDDYLEVKLSNLIEQRNKRIVFKADLLDIMFVEK